MIKVGVGVSEDTSLHWQRQGTGPDLVLLHGWGMNSAIWQPVIEQLKPHFRLHCVDLPGFGLSKPIDDNILERTLTALLQGAPQRAIWLGWSLGGLLATQIALMQPQRVAGLITVASSPKFVACDDWRGIKPEVLEAFSAQLAQDYQQTIERFIALQALGSPTARHDIKQLKHAVLSRPHPTLEALASGLNWLATFDLRAQLAQLTMPTLRVYGRLDGLVPKAIAAKVQQLQPNSEWSMFEASAHAPFMTESTLFCERIIQFALKIEPARLVANSLQNNA
ncbi:pimeloyl-ACP methyl ester esterase BioH [Vibrio sp. SM6]|uniref:Pimeloyl-[acyl-carrier protein] methyl ester esterase n=1 Tax=Vibrio agarilyticus TaxID=2726741 RepID=A0A7X8YI21_9VIBR|nr:pimeloyl-ACP methyl ester esterase BioH [Vibrio agarilyticus]NLS13942.1 pimeloyl-ACP methyl ester esterase BioH [Vibrio agarilyticus]